jgi:hypothetical protein
MQWVKVHVVNLDNYFEFSQGHPKIMILDFPSTRTHVKKSITPLVPNSTIVKCKRSNVFSPILEVLDKNNRVLVDVMECINVT